MYRASFVLASAFLTCLPVARAGGDERPARRLLALEQEFKDVVKQAEPSVVCILVSRSDAYSKLFHDSPPVDNPGKLGSFDPRKPVASKAAGASNAWSELPPEYRKYDLADPRTVPEAFGSGVVIEGGELLILTAYHVIRDATKIYVRLPGGKGSYADIHAADPRSDLAVLRLLNQDLRPLKAITFGNGGRLEKGQFVVSLTNPYTAGFRDSGATMAWGIISNIRLRAAPWPWEEEERSPDHPQALYLNSTLLQTDVPLSLGCSGGALMNLKGEMIGLTTARAAVSGSELAGGFAVPVDGATKRIIDKLRQGLEVEYGFLGVQHQNSPTREEGVYVTALVPGSPAQMAGLQPPYCIESINGIHLRNYDDLYVTVASLLAGTEARLAVRGRPEPLTVTLAKSLVRGKIIASRKPEPVRGIRVDHTSVLFLQQDRRGAFFGRQESIHPGVIVREVQPESRAAPYLKVNDVITSIKVRGSDVPVNSPAEFYREVAKVGAREPLELTLWNNDWRRDHTTPKVTIP
jgi:serine protease Do